MKPLSLLNHIFSEENAPPVVYFRYTDETLRWLVKTLRERTATFKDKVADPYASSPEITPPVSKYGQKQSTQLATASLNSALLSLLSAHSEEGGIPQTEGRGADSERGSGKEGGGGSGQEGGGEEKEG